VQLLLKDRLLFRALSLSNGGKKKVVGISLLGKRKEPSSLRFKTRTSKYQMLQSLPPFY